MSGDSIKRDGWISIYNGLGDFDQPGILCVRVGRGVGSLQFDTYGIVIASWAIAEFRLARMPGPHFQGDVLDQLSGAPDKQVAGYLLLVNLGKERMGGRVQTIKEKILDPRPAKLVGR